MLGLGLRFRTEMVCECRFPRLRRGRGLRYGSGKSPRLATRPLTLRTWLCRLGKGGRVFGVGKGNSLFCLLRDESREYCSRGAEAEADLLDAARRSDEKFGLYGFGADFRYWSERCRGSSVASSLRPMSSKWLTSVSTLSSEPIELRDDDFEDFEVVIPGGEPGLGVGSPCTGRS